MCGAPARYLIVRCPPTGDGTLPGVTTLTELSDEQAARVFVSRDARFDGWLFLAVTSTGIYCRPSCPAPDPKREHMRFFTTAAAAQGAGYRACKRCRPDAAPGSPQWRARGDVVGRALRLIADGVVDREGVAGLARRMRYSERQLHRLLVAEVGAGAQGLARAQRAQTARLLLETTDLPVAVVARVAGFGSERQLRETTGRVFGLPPSSLRRRPGRSGRPTSAASWVHVPLVLPVREPFDGQALLSWFAARAVPAVEHVEAGTYTRSLRLPHGPATVRLTPGTGQVQADLHLADLRDLAVAVHRLRRLLDLDADPVGVADALCDGGVLQPLVHARPGLRLPACVDGAEQAVRAVLGQQVSVAAAVTHAARLVAAVGEKLPAPVGPVSHLFPTATAVAGVPDDVLAMPAGRRRALRGVAGALADGSVALDPGVDRDEAEAALLALPGVGPWTARYVRLRALADPDVLLGTDLGIRRALTRLGLGPASVAGSAERWRPYRSYATQHLWTWLADARPASRAA